MCSLSAAQPVPWSWTDGSLSLSEKKSVEKNSKSEGCLFLLTSFSSNTSVNKMLCLNAEWKEQWQNYRGYDSLASCKQEVCSQMFQFLLVCESVTALVTLSFICNTAVTINSHTNSLLSLRETAFNLLNWGRFLCVKIQHRIRCNKLNIQNKLLVTTVLGRSGICHIRFNLFRWKGNMLVTFYTTNAYYFYLGNCKRWTVFCQLCLEWKQ